MPSDDFLELAEPEVALPSGRDTFGVVRVGDTVRRPRKPSSEFTTKLLQHLATHGFAGAPRHLGTDALGRDVLTFIPGFVPLRFARFKDDQLVHAARILRRLHDVTRTMPSALPVICHNDPGPNNFVFQNEQPIALIDFDMAAPGDPIDDLGYMCWSWCISSKADRQPAQTQAHQVRIISDAYGLFRAERARLIAAILERQERNVIFWESRAGQEGNGYTIQTSRERINEIIEWSRRERLYVVEHTREFDSALQ